MSILITSYSHPHYSFVFVPSTELQFVGRETGEDGFLSQSICIFYFNDVFTIDESTVQSGTLGNEDLFITWTCSTPPPVLGHSAHVRGAEGVGGTLPTIIAMSVESTLIRVLKSLEVTHFLPIFFSFFSSVYTYFYPSRKYNQMK